MFNLLSYFHNKYKGRIIECDETLDYRANFEHALKFTKGLGFNEGSITDLKDGELDYHNMMAKVCHEAEVDSFSFQQGNVSSGVISFSHILNPHLAVKFGRQSVNYGREINGFIIPHMMNLKMVQQGISARRFF
ncbi:hypothetical protein IVU49_22280 [Salmonella enterica subsp. enterica serovar Worthington]|nr:hypothetical protein [Salmonella enterica subsp. enterica serovar Worthington]